MSIVSSWENIDCVITALHRTHIPTFQYRMVYLRCKNPQPTYRRFAAYTVRLIANRIITIASKSDHPRSGHACPTNSLSPDVPDSHSPSPDVSLQWRHDGRDSVFNHQPHDCFLSHLLRHRYKKTSKLHVKGLCAGNSPEAFPAQMASNTENISIWWRHHVFSDLH